MFFYFNKIVNLTFIFCLITSPIYVYNLITIDDFTTSQLVNAICLVLFFLNFASHFGNYLFVFRLELDIMLSQFLQHWPINLRSDGSQNTLLRNGFFTQQSCSNTYRNTHGPGHGAILLISISLKSCLDLPTASIHPPTADSMM